MLSLSPSLSRSLALQMRPILWLTILTSYLMGRRAMAAAFDSRCEEPRRRGYPRTRKSIPSSVIFAARKRRGETMADRDKERKREREREKKRGRRLGRWVGKMYELLAII